METKDSAVLMVDVQGDFTTACQGSLAVGGADQAYVDAVAARVREFRDLGFPVMATQDWHPADHVSFFTNHRGNAAFDTVDLGDGRTQILWPPHCVQGTEKAKVLVDPGLLDAVVQKGMDPRFDSYSGFFDDGGQATGLEGILRERGIRHLTVFGLATDYCVRATVMDAVDLGFGVTLIRDLCRGVAKESTRAALEQMAAARVDLR